MPAPFAALEARTNAAVFKRLSNAYGTLGGVAVEGIFNAKPKVEFEIIGGVNPTFEIATASVPAEPRGLALVITGGATYTVRDFDHDGTGMTVLQLEAV